MRHWSNVLEGAELWILVSVEEAVGIFSLLPEANLLPIQQNFETGLFQSSGVRYFVSEGVYILSKKKQKIRRGSLRY